MDKNAIKKFAVWARTELIARVMQKALTFGIEEMRIAPANTVIVDSKPLTDVQQTQRNALIYEINQKGYQHVMEDVAYTWFNRFIALRFMEVNGYLPSRVRVFTDDTGKFNPQIIDEAIHLDLDGLDMEKVYAYKEANQTGALYRYLLTTQCNALSKLLPRMFQPIQDYTELLLPDNLLREGSVIEQMVTLIPEEDWQDQVQIIGWLYQYYNTEPKDKVFADLKKNIKISKEKIPAATQLFTPDWIVRYMVENSLGRLWLEGHPNETLKAGWKYYLDEAEQEPAVQEQLAKIREGYAAIKPEDIRVIDPCMGSGHILVYMFDVLVQIYEDYGYTTREAVESIIQHNLYGLDIDDRAAQLAYFAVMMKARQYDRRFLSRKDENGNPNIPQPHVYAIVESNGIDHSVIKQLGAGMPGIEYNNAVTQMNALLDTLHDAKEYGSILTVDELDWALLRRFVTAGVEADQISVYSLDTFAVVPRLYELIDVGEALGQKYDAVVTNPPYMGSSGMSDKLGMYVKDNYSDSKSDLFAVFVERCGQMTKPNAFHAMITQHAWMFLTSYEKLRNKLLHKDFCNMVHLGAHAFEEIGGEVVQTCSFVVRNSYAPHYVGTYCRLTDANTHDLKETLFHSGNNRFCTSSTAFEAIPGNPFVYWFGAHFMRSFVENVPLKEVAYPRKGLVTLDNERFVRLWHEVDFGRMGIGIKNGSDILASRIKWVPIHKGGLYRKWYGNNFCVVNWENNGKEIKDNIVRTYKGGSYTKEVRSEEKYFLEGITWTVVSTTKTSFRRYDEGFIFSNSGESVTSDLGPEALDYLTGLLNSKYAETVLSVLSPTMGFESGYVGLIPTHCNFEAQEYVCPIVQEAIALSQNDWDSFEISWDFQQHPLVRWISTPDATSLGAAMMHFYGYLPEVSCRLELAWLLWQGECEERFKKLKANEEELNRIFIDIYGLQDELTPDVDEKDVTVRHGDLGRDIRSLISYAVGVMFGRYSLSKPGLVLAGQPYSDKFVYSDIPYAGTSGCSTQECYLRDGEQLTKCYYAPDRDNVLPICDDEYFEDDIVGKFVKFIEIVYGEEDLEANLAFIANALGGKGTPREVIRNYFLNDFYKDHLKIYQKRPIYWLFDSGKKNGFKCLIYMHRYAPDTIARIRTDYVHEQQSRYRTALSTLEGQIAGASGSERVRLTKQQQKLQAQTEEIRLYEEKIHHLADQMIAIDLDDGVKHNYEIFKAVLAPIK